MKENSVSSEFSDSVGFRFFLYTNGDGQEASVSQSVYPGSGLSIEESLVMSVSPMEAEWVKGWTSQELRNGQWTL